MTTFVFAQALDGALIKQRRVSIVTRSGFARHEVFCHWAMRIHRLAKGVLLVTPGVDAIVDTRRTTVGAAVRWPFQPAPPRFHCHAVKGVFPFFSRRVGLRAFLSQATTAAGAEGRGHVAWMCVC